MVVKKGDNKMKENNEMTLENCINEICRLPIRFRTNKIDTPLKIYNDTKYTKYHSNIVQEDIVDLIKANSELIEEWLLFSENKRCSPAWFFQKASKNFWEVGYMTESAKIIYKVIFNNSVNACAHMIRMEMEEFRLKS